MMFAFKLLRWFFLFAALALVILGVLSAIDYAADGFWPWQTHREVQQ